ncbi:MAG: prepilin peptidase [Anaerolineae bacterium]|nr:prepilin peptidase [Anaerolineae bacterium]
MPFLFFIVGIAVGSFLNVVIDRVPERESLFSPPSHCPYCGRQLLPSEMIPLISYLRLRGRCRTCGAPIPWRVPLIELLTGVLFVLLWLTYRWQIDLWLAILYSCILLVITVIDLEHKLIPNVIILPATVLAVLLALLRNLFFPPPLMHFLFLRVLFPYLANWPVGIVGFLGQIAGGLLAFAIFFLIWVIAPQGMGAGDVKLAAFAGLLTAFPGVLFAIAGSFILGGLTGVILLASGIAHRKTAIPFAPFLTITTWAILLYGNTLLRWYLNL